MKMCIGNVFLLFSGLTVFLTFSVGSMLTESDSDSSSSSSIIPTNSNSSVEYLLYTPENLNKACYIEPNASVFDKCFFNTSYQTKFEIHGYQTKLRPGNLFEKLKNILFENGQYNVIIVNWTRYNQQDYPNDVVNAYIVGLDVAKLINFLVNYTGVSPTSIHLIGHSLGAHIAGTAGKHVSNLGRISGLDPAGPGYIDNDNFRTLASTDAELVDVIHTSNTYDGRGFGDPYPMGRFNFYPNGGENQPMCAIGKNYNDTDGVTQKVRTPEDQSVCFHDSSVTYFVSSVLDCEYISTQCTDYTSYMAGQCKPNTKDRMGFHCMAIPGLPDHSKFYLKTSGSPPYC